MPCMWKLSSFVCGTESVNVRLNRIKSRQSMRNPGSSTPLPFIRRAQSTTSAAPTRTFFGSQPRRAHVPPNGRLSMIATLHPAARHLDATVEAAEPVPIQIKSKRCAMVRLLNLSPAFCNPDYVLSRKSANGLEEKLKNPQD